MFGCGACALLRWLEIGSIGLAGHGFLSEPQIVLRDHAFSSVEPAFRFPHDLEQSERVMRFVAAGDRIPSQDHECRVFESPILPVLGLGQSFQSPFDALSEFFCPEPQPPITFQGRVVREDDEAVIWHVEAGLRQSPVADAILRIFRGGTEIGIKHCIKAYPDRWGFPDVPERDLDLSSDILIPENEITGEMCINFNPWPVDRQRCEFRDVRRSSRQIKRLFHHVGLSLCHPLGVLPLRLASFEKSLGCAPQENGRDGQHNGENGDNRFALFAQNVPGPYESRRYRAMQSGTMLWGLLWLGGLAGLIAYRAAGRKR